MTVFFHVVTNKILSHDLINIKDVVMSIKFEKSKISMREVFISSLCQI